MKLLLLLLLAGCSTMTLEEQWAEANACEVDCEGLKMAAERREMRRYETKLTCRYGTIKFCHLMDCRCIDRYQIGIFVN